VDHQAVSDLVATTRTDTLISTGTYGGAAATFVTGALNWLSANQSGLAVLVMVITGVATLVSTFYGVYHKHCLRKIAATQGFEALRRSDL
jgi:hypothetical protein